jgi:uncharacterized protein
MAAPAIVIAGASGVIGRHLSAAFRDDYRVTVLTRRVEGVHPDWVTPLAWRPDAARAGDEEALSRLTSALEGAAALVNLAGTSIDDGRLGPAHVDRLLESRVDSTTTLVTAMQRCRVAPGVVIQASGTGYYGQRGDEPLTEDAGPGSGFVLTPVLQAWEAAAAPAAARSRLCVLRIGVVLARDAPAWQKLLMPTRLGLGGRLGRGTQWYAWIHAHDLSRAIRFLVENDDCHGTFNAVAPEAVQQARLGRAAARRLRRPFWFPVPAWALRLLLGRLADGALLQSARVEPAHLLQCGFRFERGSLEDALDELLPPRRAPRP